MPAPSPRIRPSPYHRPWTTLTTAWRFAVGMLTVFPVRAVEADRRLAGRAMALAPVVGLVLGLAAAVILATVRWAGGTPLLAAVLAVGTLAWLTRGLHLDGLADLADGLGSGRPAEQALAVMKRSDIGAFGVITLALTLLAQIAALTALTDPAQVERSPSQTIPADAVVAGLALISASVTGRLAITWACRGGVPAARPGGLGALVAQTVRPHQMIAATVVSAAAVTAAVAGASGLGAPLPLLASMAAGLVAAELLRRRAVRRLGGVTGDVLGALCECAATVTLLCCALLR